MYTITETPARPRLMIPTPPPPAPTARPWIRLSWLAGVALLTASLVGASHVLNSRPAGGPGQGAGEGSFSGQPGVVCLGTYDSENAPGGFVPLSPLQPGEVIDVPVQENQPVKKGDLLLRVDDEIQLKRLAEAEIGVRLAEAQVTEAQQGAEQYRAAVDGQQAAVSAATHKLAAAQHKFDRANKMKKSAPDYTNPDDIAAAGEEVEALKAALAAEEAKFRGIQANKPDAKIRGAQENLSFARHKVEEAQLAVKRCRLEAPSDGVILRLTVAKGTVLGPQSRQAPVLFAPEGRRVVRAEVPQEFAHRVQVGMSATVQDETNGQVTWHGQVMRLGAAYLPKRSAFGPESLALAGSEERVLECLVVLDDHQPLPLLGQRLRVNIGTHGGQ
jgi:multidrug resistance efflux pump